MIYLSFHRLIFATQFLHALVTIDISNLFLHLATPLLLLRIVQSLLILPDNRLVVGTLLRLWDLNAKTRIQQIVTLNEVDFHEFLWGGTTTHRRSRFLCYFHFLHSVFLLKIKLNKI